MRHFNRQNGRLHHNRALAQLVDALWRGGKAFYYIVDKGAQLGVRLLTFRQRGLLNLLAELTHELLQEVRILVDFGVVPVDAPVFAVYDAAHHPAVDLCFIQQMMKGNGRDGAEMGRLNALNLADQSSVVVLTTNKQLRFGTNLHNFGAVEHQSFLNCLRRVDLGFVLRRFGGGTLRHVFLRFGKQKLYNLGNCISP